MTKLTGVGFVLSVGHNSPEGVLHGHSYEGIAWYRFGADARALQRQVEAVSSIYDHIVLPDDISLGENLAERIGSELPGCIRVNLDRKPERIYAVWEAL